MYLEVDVGVCVCVYGGGGEGWYLHFKRDYLGKRKSVRGIMKFTATFPKKHIRKHHQADREWGMKSTLTTSSSSILSIINQVDIVQLLYLKDE
jgi:hypothetical protein